VDDFGTGYSSMSYLQRFPIDKLKIDRTFINDVTSSNDDASIVSAIVSLGHTLNLKVIAEGVETPEQLEFLQMLGCDQYQGYHYSRPMPAAEFAELIRRDGPGSEAATPAIDQTCSRLSLRRPGGRAGAASAAGGLGRAGSALLLGGILRPCLAERTGVNLAATRLAITLTHSASPGIFDRPRV